MDLGFSGTRRSKAFFRNLVLFSLFHWSTVSCGGRAFLMELALNTAAITLPVSVSYLHGYPRRHTLQNLDNIS
jgi:hypothetical protein